MNPRRALVVAAPLLAVAASMPVPASATASTVCVEIVVDYGQLYAGKVSATCVVVPKGTTGAEILNARARKLGLKKSEYPRYRADGLLCAIDGKPEAPDCAEQTGDGGFKYWSYWHKQLDSSWTYAQSGPFDYSVTGDHPGEGWSWVEGKEKNSRPPAPVSYSRVCPLTAPTPEASATKPSSSTTHPSGRSAAQTSAPSTQRSSAATATPRATTSTGASTANSVGTTPSPGSSEVAIADPPRKNDNSGTPLPGVLAGAAMVVGLGGAAFWRARRANPQ
jgi:hypothetical protein